VDCRSGNVREEEKGCYTQKEQEKERRGFTDSHGRNRYLHEEDGLQYDQDVLPVTRKSENNESQEDFRGLRRLAGTSRINLDRFALTVVFFVRSLS
jgi:hypothetical protein